MRERATTDFIQPTITTARRDGNTTRLVDNAIQIIFSGDICVVVDHHEDAERRISSNKYLFDLIIRRLHSEHNAKYLIESKRLEIGKNKDGFMTIKLN